MTELSDSLLRKLHRVVRSSADHELGEAAVGAGIITAEQFLECERLFSAEPESSLRRILEERCAIARPVIDLLGRLAHTNGGRKSLGGRYELRGEVGRGGSGVVYRAWDVQLHRMVAVKLLRSDLAVSDRTIARLKQEAFAIARLRHPHLMGLYEVGEVEGLPYLVLELLEGPSLADQIGGKEMTARQAVERIEKVARAIHFAHTHGIVHRDIKPGNIKIDGDGDPHVIDFGLAHLYGSEDGLTKTGDVVGTPAYMSPEQARGDPERLDAPTDVYGLGATLYESLTGRPPFSSATLADIYQKIVTEDPLPPRKVNPALHPELEVIVLKAMEKMPGRRYASAEEFADDLRRHLDGDPIRARPASIAARSYKAFRRHKTTTILASTLILLGLGFGVAFAVRSAARSGKLNRLRGEVKGALREDDWGRAASCCEEALALSPGDPDLKFQQQIARTMVEANLARVRLDELLREYEATKSAFPKSGDSDSERSETRKTLRRSQELDRAITSGEHVLEQLLRAAMGLDPELLSPRLMLRWIYVAKYLRGKEIGLPSASVWLQAAKELGYVPDDEKTEWSTVRWITEPPGAFAFLFRYEEATDRNRLFPYPCDARGQPKKEGIVPFADSVARSAGEEAKRKMREGSAYPLEPHEELTVVPPLRLPPGSYVILLERKGSAKVRVPIYVKNGGQEVSLKVSLPRIEDVPPNFAFIPSAEDGDLPSFFMARFSVTCGEYAEFLNDRDFHTIAEAERRAPRHRQGFWRRETERFVPGGDDWPVDSISPEDAEAYAFWCTARWRKRGRPWTFRLPTNEEWVQAARGADHRVYPWGVSFERVFAAMGESCSSRTESDREPIERYGLFPADESPYGVRDLAGVISNILQSSGKGHVRLTKGGTWNATPGGCNILVNGTLLEGSASPFVGFRLAASADR